MDPLETLTQLLLIGFSSYRLTFLLVYDDGPNDWFRSLRETMGAADIGFDGRPETQVGRVWSCAYCMGFWVTLVISPLALFEIFIPFLIITAAWGIQHYLSGGYVRNA